MLESHQRAIQELESKVNTMDLENDLLEAELEKFKRKQMIMQRRLKSILIDMWSDRIFNEEETCNKQKLLMKTNRQLGIENLELKSQLTETANKQQECER